MEWASKWSSAKRRRRTAVFRILLLVLIVWFCYDTAIHRSQARQNTANAANAPVGESTTDTSLESDDSSSLQKIPRQKSDDRQLQAALHPPHDVKATGVAAVDPPRRIDLRDALHRILTLLPDELHVRDLLRPIAGTGEERLREMGLRTRSFRTLFEAWEDLHTFAGLEAMYVRDDMITYIRNHPELASSLQTDMPQLVRSYETYRMVITRLSMLLFPWTAPYFSDHTLLHSQLYSGGRGLVFSAGDAQAPFLLTSIPSIRRLGCDLPIEVLYLGDGDLSEDFRSDLESLPGVITRDLSQMVNDSGWTLAGWAGKPFAILLSSFREVIFIDADSLFFQNPEMLFEDPAYVKTGALFFKDRLMMPEAKKRWLQRIIPKPISKNVVQSRLWTGESGHMQESGVVVVDKWKHFVALLLVTRMNGPDRDGDASVGKVGVYDMVYGDKETFWLGWELAGDTGYAFHDGDAGIMGVLEPSTSPGNTVNDNETSSNQPDEVSIQSQAESANYTICGPQLLHLDRDGKPLWFNGWLLPNKFAEHKHQKPADFEAYLREPREIRDPGAWQLHENNICCLTSTTMAEFSDVERDTLGMILEYGRHSGALKAGKK